ncbi:MAG: hypothetical protein FJZ01_23200 [Candidatus Sericytochromatia bacterium]|nr:hypothetical protein [Candidatus Tanganyikabacteria bacterium]
MDVSGVEVTGNPRPHLEVAHRCGEAYDRHAWRVATFIPDRGCGSQTRT